MTELGTVLDGKYEILKKVGQGVNCLSGDG